ncbi:hypothetical protein SODALDRAFT_333094 [Sodiomyces alkalinus F11]|uniref:WHIM1 domain-containing protein n=1 Tax=Sodiomyces alkalinus (strain CBS 110278 / VKM F-3762 / F11) TaxID=1314773 RepID=A0A3N2PVH3_SODAK|nr:hypothetical protein SODALDRAFT_333094 [Sodiomyces alkalinus F11]ROT38499.1 hypothetical protein SODALDRAFT_333094 [Sodiomyces alkalinus F11]
MTDDSSDLSSLSSLSPVPSDIESDGPSQTKNGILKFFNKLPKGEKKKPSPPVKEPSPPPRKRSPSPPHEYTLADNPDIAFIVMFRSRFNEVFPKNLSNFGPQELENDISDTPPGQRVENFLCALLGLLLNRKQDVKPGHYMRALEDAISSHKSQWPRAWDGKSPLSGGASFHSMVNTERLTLLRALALWSLSGSEAIRTLINKSYRQNRHEDDLNQPLSVQPWGTDWDKRRYYLIEGLDDTAFRVYRESNPANLKRTWWSVAGSIEELTALADKLETKDGGPKARKLAQKMMTAIPRFEATEEKRRRREYRQAQKNRFKRPSPGFSLYEGRTRGKRIKYTFSDEEDDFYTDSTRRSTRNTGTHTPAEPAGPTTTASGRQVRAPNRLDAAAAGSATVGAQGDGSERDENALGRGGRPRRSAAIHHGTNGWSKPTRSRDVSNDMDVDEDPSEPELGDDEEGDEHVPEESEEEEEEDDEFNEDEIMVDDHLEQRPRGQLIVELKVNGSALSKLKAAAAAKGALTPSPDSKDGEQDGERKPSEGARQSPSEGIEPADTIKDRTPEPEDNKVSDKMPATPLALQPTSLALRGSPDKQQDAADGKE